MLDKKAHKINKKIHPARQKKIRQLSLDNYIHYKDKSETLGKKAHKININTPNSRWVRCWKP